MTKPASHLKNIEHNRFNRRISCRNKLSTTSYLWQKIKLILLSLTHKISKEEALIQKKHLSQKRNLSRRKLGIVYNVFDGEELLEASIKSIQQAASYIAIVYQNISNFGEPATPELEKLLYRLKNEGLVDELYLYEPKFNQADNHYNEKKKRDIGLMLAKRAGCDYFLSMDTDEFYHAEQLTEALKIMRGKKIKSSAVSIIEYLKEPTYQLVNGYTFAPSQNKQDYIFYVPFIMKIHHFKKQHHNSLNFPCTVDPTRGLNCNEKFYLFEKQLVAMHHMCTIRKNLARKYANSNLQYKAENSSLTELQHKILSFDFNKNLVEVSNFDGIYVQKVPNSFDIDIKK